MTKKSRIVMVAGKASHGSGSHEHPGGCAFLADQLNKNVDMVWKPSSLKGGLRIR